MIARFATSPPVTDPEIRAKRLANAQQRLKPALVRQPGFRLAVWLQRPDGVVHSITVFDSEDAMRAAADAANAQPLLAGHEPAELPGPGSGQTVEVFQVLDFVLPEETRG